MNKQPLPLQKVLFNCNRLIVLTHKRKDLTTSQKALKWHKIKEFKKSISK
jgi:hypothetical protein